MAALTILCSAHTPAQTTKLPQSVSSATRSAVEYQLPSLPLKTALAAIQKQFDQKIEYEDAPLGALRSQPVTGNHTIESALAQALAGTGYGVHIEESGTLRIVRDGVTKLSTVVVVAKRDQAESGFKADYSTTSARSGLSLMETPAGVTIITAKVIESQQATNLADVLANVSGIVATPGSQGGQGLAIRGFNTPLLSNGLATTAESTAASSGTPSVDEIQRIEVLKGPQAVLAGSGILGGAVNIVYKKPQADTIRNLKIRTGDNGNIGVSTDLSGAFSENDKRLTYRLIAVNDTARTSAGGYDGRSEGRISPSLRYKDSKTDITVMASYGRTRETPNEWTTSVDGVIQKPLPRRPGNPSDGITSTNHRVTIDLEQRLPYEVVFVSRLQQETESERTAIWLPLALLDSKRSVVGFMGTNGAGKYNNLTGDHYVRGSFASGPIDHKLVLGFGHAQSKRNATYYVAPGFLPVVLSDPAAVFPVFGEQLQAQDRSVYKQLGFYLQDTITWGATSVVVGARRTKAKDEGLVYTPAPGQGTATSTKPTESSNPSSSVGVVHAVTDSISLYAVAAKGFKPNFGTWCGAQANSNPVNEVRTMTSNNKEVGAKFDLLDGNLSITTGLFDLKQRNRPQYNQSGRCNILVDGQESKGLDIDIQGQVITGLNLIGNFTKSKISDMKNPSTKFDGQPEYQSSVWAVYKMPWAPVQGMSIGLGASFYGKTTAGAAFSPKPVEIPAWNRVDTTVSYESVNWWAALSVKNISNKTLYGYSVNPLYIPVVSNGRTAQLTVGFRL